MQDPIFNKIVLLILDGFGVASPDRGNAISLARPKKMDALIANFPAITLQAAGPLVGLPWGEMGNSEVGHLNIGAGRIVGQDLPRITASIQSGEFFKNPVFIEACQHVQKNNSKLHLLGMLSPGGVHSYDEHLYALLGLVAEYGIANVFVHMITDGRDTEEKEAMASLEKLHTRITQIGVGKIATVAGRFYAMDRAEHWQQTEMMYQAMVNAIGETAESALDCIATNYAKGVYDEMIKPTVILDKGQPVAKVEKGDAVIFFNFRQDRAIQLTVAFVQPERMKIELPHPKIEDLYFATMTSYMADLPVHVAFPQLEIKNTLADIIAQKGFKQYHTAESEKFAHVTSFFNGGQLDALPGEERVIVKSPSNANNYADHPEMSAEAVVTGLIDKINHSDVNFYVGNLANCDMVGHTGNLQATISAVKAVDEQVGRLAEAVLSVRGCLLITADHGNSEQKITANGNPSKDHTTAPVPLIAVAEQFKRLVPDKTLGYDSLAAKMPDGALSDIAPTILQLFGFEKPAEMTGISLLPILEEQVEPIKESIFREV